MKALIINKTKLADFLTAKEVINAYLVNCQRIATDKKMATACYNQNGGLVVELETMTKHFFVALGVLGSLKQAQHNAQAVNDDEFKLFVADIQFFNEGLIALENLTTISSDLPDTVAGAMGLFARISETLSKINKSLPVVYARQIDELHKITQQETTQPTFKELAKNKITLSKLVDVLNKLTDVQEQLYLLGALDEKQFNSNHFLFRTLSTTLRTLSTTTTEITLDFGELLEPLGLDIDLYERWSVKS